MANVKRKAVVAVQNGMSPSMDDGYLTEEDKDALRVYGLSAAELVDREFDERGVAPASKTIQEHGKDGVDKLGYLWRRIRGKTSAQAYYDHLKSEYSGGKGFKWPYRYQKPQREMDQAAVEKYGESYGIEKRNAKRPYLDPFGRRLWKYEDVDVYLSPSSSIPRRLLVMTTSTASRHDVGVSWRRTGMQGKVPLSLRMAEWALDSKLGWFHSTFRVILVALPLQALLAFPGANAPWEMGDIDDSYLEYTGYHWKWPKHAINPLDARSTDVNRYEKPLRTSTKARLLRPRQLMVRNGSTWSLIQNPPKKLQYLFVSYHWGSFKGLSKSTKGLDRVDQMAQQLASAAGLRAYFRDEHCIASADAGRELKTSDINRMSDVIRGSHFVALLLPDSQPHRMADWGERLWTLPEGMLAPGKIRVCTYQGQNSEGVLQYNERQMSKSELTAEFWADEDADDDVPIRSLAEHYDGATVLSRLELFSNAIAALSVRKTTEYSGADLGYALMGLLHYRVEPDPTDDLFQVIARLSLANDNDRLIERCISMYPSPTNDIKELLRMLSGRDQYQTHLWDITPRCEIVGVGDEPNTVILSECRAVPIRWKRFPRIMYRRQLGIRKRIAELAVRSGAWWMAMSYTLAFTYAPILIGFTESSPFFSTRWLWYAVLLFLGIALILASFAPRAVRRLFGGQVLQSAPHLVAFEGTMPKADLERMIFGSYQNRLNYEPSSTTFAAEARHKYVRKANEPAWVSRNEHKEPLPGHRIFTLVDTGNLSISIFQAKRPPTVAIITGSEGGMLRAVLCSWRFSNDCHYRESVIRVPSSTWDQTRPAAWIKVSLQSQSDFLSDESKPRFGPPPPAVVAPTSGGSSDNSPPPLNTDATAAPKFASAATRAKNAVRPALSNLGSNISANIVPKAARLGNSVQSRARKAPTEPNTLGTAVDPIASNTPLSPISSPVYTNNGPNVEAATSLPENSIQQPSHLTHEAAPQSGLSVPIPAITSMDNTVTQHHRDHAGKITASSPQSYESTTQKQSRQSTDSARRRISNDNPEGQLSSVPISNRKPKKSPVTTPQLGDTQLPQTTLPLQSPAASKTSPLQLQAKRFNPQEPAQEQKAFRSSGNSQMDTLPAYPSRVPTNSTVGSSAVATSPTRTSTTASNVSGTQNGLPTSRYSTYRAVRSSRDYYRVATQNTVPITDAERRETAEIWPNSAAAQTMSPGNANVSNAPRESQPPAPQRRNDGDGTSLSATVSPLLDLGPHSWEFWTGEEISELADGSKSNVQRHR